MHNAGDVSYRSYISIITLCLAIVACDRSDPAVSGDESTSATSTQSSTGASMESGAWRVGTIEVQRASSKQGSAGPTPDDVASWLDAAIRSADGLETSDVDSDAFLTYRVAVVDGVAGIPADEQPFVRVQIQGRLSDPSRPDGANEMMALSFERDKSLADESADPADGDLSRAVEEVIEEYVAAVESRFELYSASDARLVELLADDALAPEAALAGIHEARDRRIEAAVPVLTGFLEHESPSVVVAAAAALVQMKPEESATSVVAAAGKLGRHREYAALHRLIYIIGDLDDPVAREYLEGMTSHKIPDIRRAAQQVMRQTQAEDGER